MKIILPLSLGKFNQSKGKKKWQRYDSLILLVYGLLVFILFSISFSKDRGTKFRVIIADARPQLEGRKLLQRLVAANIECSYVLLNAVSYLISSVTKVILGAASLFSNGTVLSRVGSVELSNCLVKPLTHSISAFSLIHPGFYFDVRSFSWHSCHSLL